MAIRRPDELTGFSSIGNNDIFIVQKNVDDLSVQNRRVGKIKKSDLGFIDSVFFSSEKSQFYADFRTKYDADILYYPKSNPSNFLSASETGNLNFPSLYPRTNPSGFIHEHRAQNLFYSVSNPSNFTSVTSSDFYPRGNPSGYLASGEALNVFNVKETQDSQSSRHLSFEKKGSFSSDSPLDPTLYLFRGETYYFRQDDSLVAGEGKGLHIYTEPFGNKITYGLDEISEMPNSNLIVQNNNNTSGGLIKIEIPQDAPDKLLYSNSITDSYEATGQMIIVPQLSIIAPDPFDDSHLYPTNNPSGYITNSDVVIPKAKNEIDFFATHDGENPTLRVGTSGDGTYEGENIQKTVFLTKGIEYALTCSLPTTELEDPYGILGGWNFLLKNQTGSGIYHAYTQGVSVSGSTWTEENSKLTDTNNPTLDFKVPQDSPRELFYGLAAANIDASSSTGRILILDASDMTFEDGHLYPTTNPSGYISNSETGQLGSATKIAVFGDAATFSVGSPHNFMGYNNTGQAIYLSRGLTYDFILSTSAGDGFKIQDIGGVDFEVGVKNNGATEGVVSFTVPYDSPTRLKYQSTSQATASGAIHIIDKEPDYSSVFYPADSNPSGYAGAAVLNEIKNNIQVRSDGSNWLIGDASYYDEGNATNPELYLDRGSVYYFNCESFGGENFSIKTTPTTGDSNTYYTKGVTGNQAEDSTLTFRVPYDAPEVLYYAANQSITSTGKINIPAKTLLTEIRSDIVPVTSGLYDLGSASNAWKDLYVSDGSIHVGGESISLTESGITFSSNLAIKGQISQNGDSPIDLSDFVTRSETGVFLTSDDDSSYVTKTSTGNFVTTDMTGNFLTSDDDSSYVTKALTGNFVTIDMTGNFLTSDDDSSYVTKASTGNFVTIDMTGHAHEGGSLSNTGNFLTNNMTGFRVEDIFVDGDISINEYLYHKGDPNTFMRIRADKIEFEAGGSNFIEINEGDNDSVTINKNINDIDFKVYSDDGTELIRTDAANNMVGIGHRPSAPLNHTLDVSGDIRATAITGQKVLTYSLSGITGHIKKLKVNNEFYFESPVDTVGIRASVTPKCTIGDGFSDGLEAWGNLCHNDGHYVNHGGYISGYSGIYTENLVSGHDLAVEDNAVFGTGEHDLAIFKDCEGDQSITFNSCVVTLNDLPMHHGLTGNLGIDTSDGRVYVTPAGGGGGSSDNSEGQAFSWFLM